MRTITVGFGREVNRDDYKGHKVASGKRGVWLLPFDTFRSLTRDVMAIAGRYGAILFAGIGYGQNTVTGESGEQGFMCVIQYEGRTEAGGIAELREALKPLLVKYGQREFAFTDGQSELVGEE